VHPCTGAVAPGDTRAGLVALLAQLGPARGEGRILGGRLLPGRTLGAHRAEGRSLGAALLVEAHHIAEAESLVAEGELEHLVRPCMAVEGLPLQLRVFPRDLHAGIPVGPDT
jgi:hypothetical protein